MRFYERPSKVKSRRHLYFHYTVAVLFVIQTCLENIKLFVLQYFLNPNICIVSMTSEPFGKNSSNDYNNFKEATAAKVVNYENKDIFDG